MKTLVVLSALAAIATAAPALPDKGYRGYRPVSYPITPTFRREKKSPAEAHNDLPVLEPQSFPRTELNQVHEVKARTFGKKKPIIVKNKLGYHLYRDSEEEQAQADSQEKCTKEVKVKLCDAENLQTRSTNLKGNSGEDNIHQSDNEMEQSIKMAKETVENLQKMPRWKHSEFGPDAEIHKDIEVARQALAHIQQNFGNLEATNMRTPMLNDAEALHDAKSQITKDERMAKWQQAIQNIQKNAEIARNLEDSFSSTNVHEHLFQTTDLTTQEKSSDLENAENPKMQITKNSLKDEKLNFNNLGAKAAEIDHEEEVKLINDEEPKTIPRNDMPIKPFEELTQDTLFSSKNDLVQKNIHSEMHEEAKSSDLDSSWKRPAGTLTTVLENHMRANEWSVKSTEPTKMDVDKAKQSGSVENKGHGKSAEDTGKSAEVNHDSKQHSIHEFVPKADTKARENSKSGWMESEDKNVIAKAAGHSSAVEQNKAELKSDSLIINKNTAKFESSTPTKSEEQRADFHKNSDKKDEMRKIQVHNAAVKSVDQVAHMSEQVNTRVLASAAETDLSTNMEEHMNAEHQHQLHDLHRQAKNWQAHHMASMKKAAVEQQKAELKSDSLIIHDNTAKFHSSTPSKSTVHQEHEDFHEKSNKKDDMHRKQFHNAAAKSVDQVAHIKEQVHSKVLASAAETDSSAKMVEHMNTEHLHQAHDFHPQPTNWHANQMASMKNAADEQKKANLKSESLIINENTAKFDSSTSAKSAKHQERENFHEKSNEKDEMGNTQFQNAAVKSGDQVAHMSEQVNSRALAPAAESDLSAKMVEHMNTEHLHQVHDFHQQAKNWKAHRMASLKNAAAEQSNANFHNAEVQRTVSNLSPVTHLIPTQHQVHFSNQAHHHHPSQFGNLVNMQLGSPFRGADKSNAQEKAAEMDSAVQATAQVNINGPSEKSALEHNAHWKQQQLGAARGAYGAYGPGGAGAIGASIGAAAAGLSGANSGGSGAIGVFPNANTGGCAIPLLLSCSPSVVSGSLAKAHSGYGAPAYRAGENFNFHTKRDIKKSNEVSAAKAQRTPTKIIQKIPYNLDKKN